MPAGFPFYFNAISVAGGAKYPHICFSVFNEYISLISLGFILRNICSGTYAVQGLSGGSPDAL